MRAPPFRDYPQFLLDSLWIQRENLEQFLELVDYRIIIRSAAKARRQANRETG